MRNLSSFLYADLTAFQVMLHFTACWLVQMWGRLGWLSMRQDHWHLNSRRGQLGWIYKNQPTNNSLSGDIYVNGFELRGF